MSKIIKISNINAPEMDIYARLTQAQLRNRFEANKGIFIAESPKVIRLALKSGCTPLSLLMERKHIIGDGAEIIALCGEIPVYTADRELLAELTGYALTRGVLCAMRRPAPLPYEQVCSNAKRVAVLDGVVDSTNIGGIFRSAAALGVDGVLLTPRCCDPLCRRAIRVSMGTVFQIPWAYFPKEISWLDALQKLDFKTVALALDSTAVTIDSPILKKQERLAIVLGTEGDGLSKDTVASCDFKAIIPMYHQVDSLNVAAASAVAFWELRTE